jgi:hypothetical protein
MVLVVDRQKANMFTLINSMLVDQSTIFDDQVPQKVKHGDDTWDAQNKIFRHIEDHLHKHLTLISQKATLFAKKNHVTNIIIGSHKPLFSKIEKNLTDSLTKKISGRFITELKVPMDEIIIRAKNVVNRIEQKESRNNEK